MENLEREALRRLFFDVGKFSGVMFPQERLRDYQVGPARALVEAVRAGKGGQFVWVFSRQAGKDETLAQVLAYLLNCYRARGGQIVVAAPTMRQVQISRDRLVACLDNWLNRGGTKQREGYIVSLGRAEARFLSASPSANVRGETASLLLVANETQDIEPEHWDAVFDPMAASTNAVTLYLGTVWTSRTLLARQMRHLRELERQDGKQRVFLVDWRTVAAELPPYGERVRARIAQFGPDHPFIRTEYELKELDGASGLFNAQRLALMAGSHSRQTQAEPGKTYCLLVDVAGEDEEAPGEAELRAAHPRRDSTAVTVVEVSSSGFRVPSLNLSQPIEDRIPKPTFGALNLKLEISTGKWEQNSELRTRNSELSPAYRVVQRYVWTGVKHSELYSRLVGLANETWGARRVVVDATGVGAGLASFLEKALPRRVLPFVFSAVSKSELGWNFLALIDSGRFKEYTSDGAEDTNWYWRQLAAVEYEVRPGPGKLLRWSVPDPTLHDDLVMSAALTAVLDQQDWRPRKAQVID
jgi:hypothetical protein